MIRFDGEKLGLMMKTVARDSREQTRFSGSCPATKTVLQAIRAEAMDPAVSRLLCVGDELVMVNGIDVTKLLFSDLMDLISTAGRPIFMTFVVAPPS